MPNLKQYIMQVTKKLVQPKTIQKTLKLKRYCNNIIFRVKAIKAKVI